MGDGGACATPVDIDDDDDESERAAEPLLEIGDEVVEEDVEEEEEHSAGDVRNGCARRAFVPFSPAHSFSKTARSWGPQTHGLLDQR